MSAAARRRGDEARSHATRWLWAYGTSPLLFPRIRKGSLLPSFEIAFPTADHDVDVGAQQRTRCEVVQRRADCRKENGHQEPPPFSLSAVQIPSAINSTKRVNTMPTVTYPKSNLLSPFISFCRRVRWLCLAFCRGFWTCAH